MPTITFKVSTDEARKIRADARGKKMTVSEFIRGRALNGGGKPGRFRQILCPHTGAKIFSSPAGTQPLTTETVREILADFP